MLHKFDVSSSFMLIDKQRILIVYQVRLFTFTIKALAYTYVPVGLVHFTHSNVNRLK